MGDSYVQANPDSTGKKIDTTELDVGLNTVERQRIVLAGAAAAALVEPISTDPAGAEFALPVRNIPSGTQAVSAAALPLPANAAQEDGGNLAALVANTPTVGQKASSASSPVTLASDQSQDAFITGAAAQSTLGNNAMLASPGTAAIDTLAGFPVSMRSFFCQVIGGAGITSGAVIFEGSNDGTAFVPLTWYDDAAVTGATINSATTISANANRFFSGKITYRYIRCRISTGFNGGTIQVITRLSPVDYVPRVTTVASSAGTLNAAVSQVTASNLNCTAYLAAGNNLIGDVGFQYRNNSTGAATTAAVNSGASTAASTIKSGGGRMVGWTLTNNTASARSVKIFNATSVTMGTTSAMFEINLPPNGQSELDLPGGAGFSSGLMWAVTAGKGLTDNTSIGLAANDVTGAVFYQ